MRKPEKLHVGRSLVRAAQGNFDHLMGVVRSVANAHNSLVDDVAELRDAVDATNLDITELGAAAGGGGSSVGGSGGGSSFSGDHDDLTNVTSDQHHAEVHDHSDGSVDHDDLTNVTSDQHHAEVHAHAADEVDIDDAGGYFTGTEVEAALQELGAAAGGTGGGPAINLGAYINALITGNRTFGYTDCAITNVSSPMNLSGDWGAVGTLISATVAGVAGHPGIIKFSTSTSASGTGRLMWGGNQNQVKPGAGRIRMGCWFRLPTLSDTEDYHFFFGLHDDTLFRRNSGNGIGIYYNDGINSGAFEALVVTAGSAASDAADDNGGSITVVANTFYYMELNLNAAGDSVELYIGTTVANKVLKATLGTLPSVAMSPVIGIDKDTGTVERTLEIDAAWFLLEHTTAR